MSEIWEELYDEGTTAEGQEVKSSDKEESAKGETGLKRYHHVEELVGTLLEACSIADGFLPHINRNRSAHMQRGTCIIVCGAKETTIGDFFVKYGYTRISRVFLAKLLLLAAEHGRRQECKEQQEKCLTQDDLNALFYGDVNEDWGTQKAPLWQQCKAILDYYGESLGAIAWPKAIARLAEVNGISKLLIDDADSNSYEMVLRDRFRVVSIFVENYDLVGAGWQNPAFAKRADMTLTENGSGWAS